MNHQITSIFFFTTSFLIFLLGCQQAFCGETRTIVDSLGRKATVGSALDRAICSGAGCLRLLTYLQAQDMVIAVDDMEQKLSRFDARPYALANPRFKKLPLFGEFRGNDNPELIAALEPQPQVIFKTFARSMGYDPDELQQKTTIPVVALNYGNLSGMREELFSSLRLMGSLVGKEQRAEEVISFFEKTMADLKKRTADIPEEKRPQVYIGGVALKGPMGFQATEPAYPPFSLAGAKNLAFSKDLPQKELQHAQVSKEQIVAWNPQYLFLDLATLQMGEGAGGLHELKTLPAYQRLEAVQQNKVYGLLPYNWYSTNYGSILANAYYIGKLLHSERFQDVDPAVKADEIYTFLVGKPVFTDMNRLFGNYVFQQVPMH